jgi:hypothetical protein
MPLQTTVHCYRYDVSKPEEKEAWQKLRAQLVKSHGKCFEALGDYYQPQWDGKTVELETTHLFNNQWNSSDGRRLFDWAKESEIPGQCARGIKCGYWLEITQEMRDVRSSTHICGWCSYQTREASPPIFCPKCIGSEYLKASNLHLLRLQRVDSNLDRPALSAKEMAELLPRYKEAQLHGNTERDKARIAKKRHALIAKRDRQITRARIEYEGMTWLMDHGIKTDDVIYYDHRGEFCFGWRANGVDTELVSELLDIISEFRWPYTIKCADGRKLEGNKG